MANTYAQKLKDPRWQKKRLKILERDKFTCRSCEDASRTLHVHHLYYDKDLKPWENEDDDLVTLCEDCHEIMHVLRRNNIDIIMAGLVIECITKQEFDNMDKNSVPNKNHTF